MTLGGSIMLALLAWELIKQLPNLANIARGLPSESMQLLNLQMGAAKKASAQESAARKMLFEWQSEREADAQLMGLIQQRATGAEWLTQLGTRLPPATQFAAPEFPGAAMPTFSLTGALGLTR